TPYASDAGWLAHALGDLLQQELTDQNASLPQILTRAAASLKKEFNAYWEQSASGRTSTQAPVYPTAGISVFRLRHLPVGDFLEYIGLGDCPAVLERTDGGCEVFLGEELASLDRKAIGEMERVARERGCSMAQARAAINDMLIAHRKMANKPGGYPIFDPTGEGIPHARLFSCPAQDAASVSLMTDGFGQCFDPFGLASSYEELHRALQDGRMAELAKALYEAQQADADLSRHPRFKLRDDMAVITAGILAGKTETDKAAPKEQGRSSGAGWVRRIGDRLPVWAQPFVGRLINARDYFAYCCSHSLLYILQLLSKAFFFYGLLDMVYGLLHRSFSLVSFVITVASLFVTVLTNLLGWKESRDAKYVERKAISGYYRDVEPPDDSWTRRVIHVKRLGKIADTGTIYSSRSVDEWLRVSPQLPAIHRDERYEAELKHRLRKGPFAAKYFPFLRFNTRLAQFYARQFTNEAKWGLSGELRPDMDTVSVHRTCYFDSFLTNISPGKQLVSTRTGKTVCALDSEQDAPYRVDAEGKKRLRPVGEQYMANEPGVTTLWLLASGTIPLWRQSAQAQSNPGQVVASGSGSADWTDCEPWLGRPDGLRRAVIAGMERELYEESIGERAISKEDFCRETKTLILGYFRWLEKAGKSEFVGISAGSVDHEADTISPEESEVTRTDAALQADTVFHLKEQLRSLVHPVTEEESEQLGIPRGEEHYLSDGCNMSLSYTVLALLDAFEEAVCPFCSEKNACSQAACARQKSPHALVSAMASRFERN
ncbi:MAG: protein phosphatase 2C domain-containing protein, partial [Clostridia bacterium]|nr:protein phosphatase 2C domain-containing protein [Clostridia bacterium]